MKIALKFFFLSIFMGVVGFSMANTTTSIPEIVNETVYADDDETPIRVRVCWTTKKGKRICITVSISKKLKMDDLNVDADLMSDGQFIIFSGFPRELNGSSLKIPTTDSGFASKEGKLYLKAGSYRINNGKLKAATMMRK